MNWIGRRSNKISCYWTDRHENMFKRTPLTSSGICEKAACWAICCCIAKRVDSSIWGWWMCAEKLFTLTHDREIFVMFLKKRKKKTYHPHIVCFDHSSQLSIGQHLRLGHLPHSKVPNVVEPFARTIFERRALPIFSAAACGILHQSYTNKHRHLIIRTCICKSGSLRPPNILLCAYIQLGSTSSRLRTCWIVTRTCPRACR